MGIFGVTETRRGGCSSADRGFKRAGIPGLGILGLALLALAAAGAASARDPDKPTPSGFPVPRWVSLKFGQVNARSGPGDDYPTVWTYGAKGLPVQVVEETREWRKICDPDGQSAWVHRRTVDGAHTVFRAKAQALALEDKPDGRAAVRAYLAPHAVADLDKCAGAWCEVKAGGVRGWAPAAELWGVGDAPRCR
jgi:SH3-like domain-containing protein